jgi:hypothetical protein
VIIRHDVKLPRRPCPACTYTVTPRYVYATPYKLGMRPQASQWCDLREWYPSAIFTLLVSIPWFLSFVMHNTTYGDNAWRSTTLIGHWVMCKRFFAFSVRIRFSRLRKQSVNYFCFVLDLLLRDLTAAITNSLVFLYISINVPVLTFRGEILPTTWITTINTPHRYVCARGDDGGGEVGEPLDWV